MGVAEQNRLAGEVLAWLESLPRTLPDDLQELPYDRRAVYHAIKFLGEVRYAPAVPLLIREAFDYRLRIDDPDSKWIVGPDDLDISHARRALIQIGPPSAPPLVDEYLRIWKLPPDRVRDGRLSVIEHTLAEDALIGAALRHIFMWFVKADLAADVDRDHPIGPDQLDALQHLKGELLKGID